MLIHGASGHLESFIFTLPYLAQTRRTVAFDLPWHGYAGYPERPFDVFDHAGFLARLVEVLELGKVALVGQSLGGAIAARATVERMLDVQRLVLIGSSGSTDGTPRDERNSMRAALTGRSYEVVKARLEHAMTSRGPEMDELIECRYLAYQLGDWDQRVSAFTFHETPEGRRRATLTDAEWRRLTCPTLLIWGDEDRVVPVAAGRAIAELVADSRLEVVTGAGHNPQFEQHELVNPILSGFLHQSDVAPRLQGGASA